MRRVLLTGATGFIGRHCLAPLIASGYEVHAVSFQARKESSATVQWHQADLLDAQQVNELMKCVQPTDLLHFAWFAVPGRYWTSLENFRWVQASLGLLQAFVQHGGQRVVMAGTCAEYDWNDGLCSEQVTALLPATLYGVCKHALQTMLDAFARQTGISVAWGRIFFVYGPYEHPARLVPSVIRSLQRGELTLCSHGNQIRDFMYVQDVADAFAALLKSKFTGPINIASGQPVRVRDVITMIGEKTQQAHLIKLGALPASPEEAPVVLADIRRLTEELGWFPKLGLATGLEKSLEWWFKAGCDEVQPV